MVSKGKKKIEKEVRLHGARNGFVSFFFQFQTFDVVEYFDKRIAENIQLYMHYSLIFFRIC